MKKTVILGISASIAAYKSCEIIRSLDRRHLNVKCVMSRDASHFITPLTLQSLSGNKVHRDMFDLSGEMKIEHISLADEADCVLIAPATADIIARIASGMSDDLLASVVCTAVARKPVLIAPAMNSSMFKNPILQDKITYLKDKGFHFIGPEEGSLACGEKGQGRLASTEKIVSEVLRFIGKRSS